MTQPRDPCPSFGPNLFPQLLTNVLILSTGFPYTMGDHDCLVACNKAAPAAAVTVKLGTPWDGRIVGVKDYKGDAGTNNITVDGNGVNIEGAATDTINVDRAERWYRYDATAEEWKRLFSGAGSGGAPAAHNHSAAEITSGTLAVARGGTGLATTDANKVFAGPASGAAAAPGARLMVPKDVPANVGMMRVVTGSNGAGAVTLTGAAVGDAVLGVAGLTDTDERTASFEATITVNDQIQQSSTDDLSTKKLVVLLKKAAVA